MKKQLFYLLIGGSLLATSCSKTPENKVTEYTSNVKGFLNGKNNEDGEAVYNIMTLTSVTDDWDGKEDYSPNSGDDKLIKVEIAVQSTDGGTDIGMLESNIALYDASTKKTFAPSSSLAAGPSFKGLMSTYETGYAVYSVPADTKLENLYLASSPKGASEMDLSKEKTENLLPLKKMDAPKEKTVALNNKFEVVDNIFELTKIYTFKSITYNAQDDKVKKYHSENPGNESASIVKVELEIENTASKNAWISMPWLVSEYGAETPDYSFGETPSEIKPGKTTFTLYYRVNAGEKVFALNGENKEGEDFSVKLK